jgi:hypothetical protein
MSQVITFENVTPTPRYDGLPWTDVIIQEALTSDAAEADWTTIDQVVLSPVDADPENPAARDFTTEGASDEPDLWYRLIFVDADGDELLPTVPIQNLTDTVSAYATATELARILKLRSVTDEQRDAMDRVLLVASGEIDSEIDLGTASALSSWQLALAQEVCLERAVEHWQQQEAAFGIIGLGGAETFAVRTARDTWDRHAHKLAPLKDTWGIA